MAGTAHNLAWLSEIDKDDALLVSSKCVLLGQLQKEGFPTPKGFVITTNAYYDFLRDNNLAVKINHLISSANFDSPKSLEQVSENIKKNILNSNLSESLIKDILKAYKKLSGLIKETTVDIKPSLVNDHTPNLHTAYNLDSLSGVTGDAVLIDKIKLGWSHAYNTGHILKRHETGQDHVKVGIALIIEEALEASVLGNILTYDTKNDDKTTLIIKDHAVVRKSDLKIIEHLGKDISEKNIKKLAEIAIKIEKLLYFPQDINFAIQKDKIFILDTKPLTFFSENDSEFRLQKNADKLVLLAEPAGVGIAAGLLRFVLNENEINKVMPGDVIVLSDSNPNYHNAIKKASAVVTLNGGKNSYAATIARKFGIPAIANAKDIVKGLTAGSIVTVNGLKGEVYKGGFKARPEFSSHDKGLKTATKLFVNLLNSDSADTVAKLDAEGVVPLKAELIFKKIGTHPKKMLRDGKKEVFIGKLADELEKVCKAFEGRPVVYRFSDLKSDEYRKLSGGVDFETEEKNPTLGFRGAFRYLHDPESFKMEAEAVKSVRDKGYSNLSVSIPFARTPEELIEVRKLINSFGLSRSSSFKVWFVIETPSNVIMLDKFLEAGVDGISVDLNALAMLTIGADRDNFEVSSEFNNLEPSLIWSLEQVIKTAQKHKITTNLYGLGTLENSELVKKLIDLGIDSLSVLPDAVDSTKRLIFQTEKSLLLK